MSGSDYHNDPRVTAYALDELSADERAEVEAWLEDSPAARAAVAEIVQLSAMLRESSVGDAESHHAIALRAAVEAKLDSAAPTRDAAVSMPASTGGRSGSNLIALALAASFLIAVSVVLFGRLGDLSGLSPDETAVRDQSSPPAVNAPAGASKEDDREDDYKGRPHSYSWESSRSGRDFHERGGSENGDRNVEAGDYDDLLHRTVPSEGPADPADLYDNPLPPAGSNDVTRWKAGGEHPSFDDQRPSTAVDSSDIYPSGIRHERPVDLGIVGGGSVPGGIGGRASEGTERGEDERFGPGSRLPNRPGSDSTTERYFDDSGDDSGGEPARPADPATSPTDPAGGLDPFGPTDEPTPAPGDGQPAGGEGGGGKVGSGEGGGGGQNEKFDESKLAEKPGEGQGASRRYEGREIAGIEKQERHWRTETLRRDASKDLADGLKLSETDPIAAETRLRLTLESVKISEDIDESVRGKLTLDLYRALDVAGNLREQYLADNLTKEAEEIEMVRKAYAAAVKERDQLTRQHREEFLKEQQKGELPVQRQLQLTAQVQHLEQKLAVATKLLEDHQKVHAEGVTSWRRSRKVPNTSRLMIGEREELPLEGMQVNVQIDGFRARVLLDCYFYNEHDRQLEGNFQLRLPNEASLYFFAFGETAYGPKGELRPQVRQAFFNIDESRRLGTAPQQIMDARQGGWKQPKEARMVTRTKAAHAYRETVRRRVDPALVEWSGAGVFSARIFPLMPRKLHRVVIGYDVNLLKIGRDLVYRLDLPDKFGDCTVDLNVTAEPGTKAVVSPQVKPFTAAGRAYFHFNRPQRRQFEVRLPAAGNVLVHGDDPDAGAYFAAFVEPELPPAKSAKVAQQAVFLVDTSLSSNPEKFNVWLSLVEATLNNNRDAIKQFAVLFFNIDQHWWQQEFVENTPQQVAALGATLRTLALEGATDLGQALRVATAPSWEAAVEGQAADRDYFLLSDGAITWGERDVQLLARELGDSGGLFAYRTGFAGTDVRTLTQLTRETGGAIFTVLNDEQIESASQAHRQRPWRIIDVEIAGGTDLILAGRPKTLFQGQQLLLVGRGLPDDGASAQLMLKRGKTVETVSVPVDRRVASDLAPRVFGQVSVAGLEELGDATESIATAYARHFRITGRTCSLLMLESEEDYRRFDIKPEDDEFVVKSTVANEVMVAAEDRAAATLGNPKAAFVAWLHRLEKTPGLRFRLSPALKVALDALPESAFLVKGQPLRCNQRTWESIPKPVRERLAARSFGYEDLMQEAQARRTRAGAGDALRALSSLVEYRPGDLVLARDVGYSAMDWGLDDQAYHLLRRVAEARPHEPQTYLAIAHCLTEMGNVDLAMVYYETVLNARWDGRFQEIHRIAGVDYLQFLKRIKSGSLKAQQNDFAMARLDSLQREIDLPKCDVLVTVMWNTDGTDVDLHVTEPSGEICYYSHPTTRSGGHITADVTQGYGPEMYTLPNASAGNYKIQAKYFAADQNRLSTRTRVFARIYENWGTPQEQVVQRTVTLLKGQEMTDILTVKRSVR